MLSCCCHPARLQYGHVPLAKCRRSELSCCCHPARLPHGRLPPNMCRGSERSCCYHPAHPPCDRRLIWKALQRWCGEPGGSLKRLDPPRYATLRCSHEPDYRRQGAEGVAPNPLPTQWLYMTVRRVPLGDHGTLHRVWCFLRVCYHQPLWFANSPWLRLQCSIQGRSG